MAIPVLQNYVGRRGDRTKASAGGVDLAQFMLVSGTPTSWAITLASGTAAHWTLPTNGTFPVPTAAGDNAELNGGPYVFNVTATNTDGTSVARTLTINIAADTYTVSTPAHIDTGLRSGLDNGVAIRPNMGGRTIEIAKGSEAAWSSTATVSFRTFETHTGRFTVTSEDPSEPTTVARIFLNGGNTRIDFEWLNAKIIIPARGPDVGQAPTGGNAQGISHIQAAYNASSGSGINTDITFKNMVLGPTRDEVPSVSQWCTSVNVAGKSTVPFVKATDFVFQDITIRCCKDGLVTSKIENCLFERITIDGFCSNSWFNGGTRSNIFRDVVIVRPMINRDDPEDHRDYMQTGAGTANENYSGNVFERVALIMADGNSGSQGPFFNDVGDNGGTASGYSQNNHTLRNVFFDGVVAQGIWVDVGTGWDIRRNTIIRAESAELLSVGKVPGQPDYGNYLPGTRATPSFQGNQYGAGSQGVAEGNVLQKLGAHLTGFAELTTNNKVLATIIPEPAGWSNQAYYNWPEQIAYYANWFADPGRVIDYPNLTPLEILAQVRLAYAPIEGGGLMNPNGTYNGSFFPDGSWNDGTVYLATPATSYTADITVDEAETGTPVTITYTLDAAAHVEVTIVPDVSGVTGTFDPATVVIALGQTTGTTEFTATTVGAATLSATNDQALANPADLVLGVVAPAVEPTEYSQEATQPTVQLGNAVNIIYELDQLATDIITIAPDCDKAGVFTPTTVVILAGGSVGSASFVAEAVGAHEFTATNDRGLLDPAPIAVQVNPTAARTGNLKRLGLRRW